MRNHKRVWWLQEWDLRKFKAPVHVWEGLPADNATTQVALSPDERLILTGTSAGRDGQGGALLFFDRQSRQLMRRIGMPASVVAVQWHPKLNQIMLGVGEWPLPGLMDVVYLDHKLAQWMQAIVVTKNQTILHYVRCHFRAFDSTGLQGLLTCLWGCRLPPAPVSCRCLQG